MILLLLEWSGCYKRWHDLLVGIKTEYAISNK